jgi:para-nitrobenzyl esterase
MKRLMLAAAAAILGVGVGGAVAAPVKVKIDSGVLAGDAEGGVARFKGVPFAKPPVGPLRWAPPQTPSPWTGERDATTFQLPCPQPVNADGKPNGGGVAGATAEDCLYLNVWAPPGAKKAPVMLWLYGGAGYLGAGHLGSYDGSVFAKDGVIVVTINYRLGALGTFAHPSLSRAAKPGEGLVSYALMDAVAGLDWVRRNIAAFGGDPTNVTLFGQSAGGQMVVNLLSVPSAKGLFHKAIVESGAGLGRATPLAGAEANGVKAATALGLPGEAASVEQLRAVPADRIVANDAVRRGTGRAVDGRFATTATVDALANGTEIDVPLILGANTGEGGFDSARRIAGLAAKGAPSYLYQFGYVPDWRAAEQPNGAPHSAELVYVFDSWATSSYGSPKVTAKDRAVSARVHSCWVAFAKASATAKGFSCADGFRWQPYTPEGDFVARFGESPDAGKGAVIEASAPRTGPAAAPAPARPAGG